MLRVVLRRRRPSGWPPLRATGTSTLTQKPGTANEPDGVRVRLFNKEFGFAAQLPYRSSARLACRISPTFRNILENGLAHQ